MRIVAISCLTLLIACAPIVEAPDGRRLRATSDEFRVYAASVFRRQNAAAFAIHDFLESGEAIDQSTIDALDDADRRLTTACEPLNRLAVARRDGREPGLSDLRPLANAVPACDLATLHAEALLRRGATPNSGPR